MTVRSEKYCDGILTENSGQGYGLILGPCDGTSNDDGNLDRETSTHAVENLVTNDVPQARTEIKSIDQAGAYGGQYCADSQKGLIVFQLAHEGGRDESAQCCRE